MVKDLRGRRLDATAASPSATEGVVLCRPSSRLLLLQDESGRSCNGSTKKSGLNWDEDEEDEEKAHREDRDVDESRFIIAAVADNARWLMDHGKLVLFISLIHPSFPQAQPVKLGHNNLIKRNRYVSCPREKRSTDDSKT